MKLSVPTLLIAGLGILLIWSGITNRNPIEVVKAILTGQPIPGPGEFGSAVGRGVGRAAREGAEASTRGGGGGTRSSAL